MRQNPIDVRVFGAKKETVKTLKTLEQTTAHFSQVTHELHVQEIGLQCAADVEEGDEEEIDHADNDPQKSMPTFILSLNAETIHGAASAPVGGPYWIIRPLVGTNLTRRLESGIAVELKNNKTRVCVRVGRIEKNSSLAALVKQVMALGVPPASIAPKAIDEGAVLAWLGNFGFAGGKEMVAFEVSPLESSGEGDEADAEVGEVQSTRALSARPSDTVDIGDPSVRSQWREFQTQLKRTDGDVTAHDSFAKSAMEMLKLGGKRQPLEAVARAITFTLQALPREFDYIAKFERSAGGKLDLMEMRQHFACRLATMVVVPDQCVLVDAAFMRFRSTMDEYLFPKYNLDVDSFASDLLHAESHDAVVRESAAASERDQEVNSLKAMLRATTRNLEQALGSSDVVAAVQAAVRQPSEAEEAADVDAARLAASDEVRGCPDDKGTKAGVLSDAVVSPGTNGGAGEDALGTLPAAVVSAGAFELVLAEAACIANQDFSSAAAVTSSASTAVFAGSIASAALDAWAVAECMASGLEKKLVEQTYGSYKATVDMDAGTLTIPFTEKLCGECKSKFRIWCNGVWLDGTQCLRQFPNAWRGVRRIDESMSEQGGEKQDPNMCIKHIAAPLNVSVPQGGGEGARCLVLKSFVAPVVQNSRAVRAGEILLMTDALYPKATAQLSSFFKPRVTEVAASPLPAVAAAPTYAESPTAGEAHPKIAAAAVASTDMSVEQSVAVDGQEPIAAATAPAHKMKRIARSTAAGGQVEPPQKKQKQDK